MSATKQGFLAALTFPCPGAWEGEKLVGKEIEHVRSSSGNPGSPRRAVSLLPSFSLGIPKEFPAGGGKWSACGVGVRGLHN